MTDAVAEKFGADTADSARDLSAVSGTDGYDHRPELDADGWDLLLRNLNRTSDRAAEHTWEPCWTPTSAL